MSTGSASRSIPAPICAAHDLPPFETLYPGERATGWIAISEQIRAFYCAGYRWLDAYRPVARIGSSIRLYYVPGPPMPPPDPEHGSGSGSIGAGRCPALPT